MLNKPRWAATVKAAVRPPPVAAWTSQGSPTATTPQCHRVTSTTRQVTPWSTTLTPSPKTPYNTKTEQGVKLCAARHHVIHRQAWPCFDNDQTDLDTPWLVKFHS